MRILAITSLYPHPGHPLLGVFHLHKMRAMAVENHVHVIVPVPWTERLSDRVKRNRDAIDSPRKQSEGNLHTYFPTYWYTPKLLHSLYGHFYLQSIRKTVEEILRDFRPELVFGLWSHPDGWAAMRIGRELGLPVVIKVVGSDVLVIGKNSRRRKMIAQALRDCDGVLAVSQQLAGKVVEMGVPRDHIHVVSEGINKNLFQPGDRAAARTALNLPQDARIILFVGNLLYSKGAGILIEACSILATQKTPFLCYLVGRGKDEPKLKQLVQTHGLSEKVIFPGPCKQDVLVNWYRACDLVTLPSYSEGIPNALREAMQCQRPFVATRVGGIPEISDPAVSRLVEPGNAAELAATLKETLDSPPTVDGSAAARFNITWAQSFQQISDLFDSAIYRRHLNSMPGKMVRPNAVWSEEL